MYGIQIAFREPSAIPSGFWSIGGRAAIPMMNSINALPLFITLTQLSIFWVGLVAPRYALFSVAGLGFKSI